MLPIFLCQSHWMSWDREKHSQIPTFFNWLFAVGKKRTYPEAAVSTGWIKKCVQLKTVAKSSVEMFLAVVTHAEGSSQKNN